MVHVFILRSIHSVIHTFIYPYTSVYPHKMFPLFGKTTVGLTAELTCTSTHFPIGIYILRDVSSLTIDDFVTKCKEAKVPPW